MAADGSHGSITHILESGVRIELSVAEDFDVHVRIVFDDDAECSVTIPQRQVAGLARSLVLTAGEAGRRQEAARRENDGG